MMAIELVLASNNEHKHSEFCRLFPKARILLPRELGVAFDFEETGATFFDNARGKALALFRKAGRPVIADDSGLCVRALGGAPGVMSNRFGAGPDGRLLETAKRNAFLLEKLTGTKDRDAFFVCCLVLVLDEDRFVAVQETVHGVITEEPRGRNGFGYDPLFLLPSLGMTLAELSDERKDDVSHRGRAARRLGGCLLLDS
ncbi:MAG TPA: RdgB/HAM1 family non-canonical purine NTP pyrophosphatase [Spirochaetia bacterium]|nr:RdgB/HAM1 family non-canonical purine NTP pyrophosphatase [Spirochaetia bacterium]